VDHLDGDVALDTRLPPPPDDAVGALAEPLEQPVTTQRPRGRLQRGILLQHLLVQPLQLGRRVDAELLGEQRLHALEGRERLCLPAGTVQSQHQVGPQSLAERVRDDQRLELCDELPAPTADERCGHVVLGRGDAQLLQTHHRRDERRCAGEVAEGRAVPQLQRPPERLRGCVRLPVEEPVPLSNQRLETQLVDLLGVDVQNVALTAAFDPLGAQDPAEMGDVALQGGPRLRRRRVAPHRVDQLLDGHDLVGAQQQVSKDQPLSGPAKYKGPTPLPDLEGAEYTDLHLRTVRLGRGGVKPSCQQHLSARHGDSRTPHLERASANLKRVASRCQSIARVPPHRDHAAPERRGQDDEPAEARTMTAPIGTGSRTHVRPGTENPPTASRTPAPPPRRMQPVWPLLILVAAALTVLAVSTLSQQRTVEEAVDQVQAPTAHDSRISMLLRERENAASTAHDSRISMLLRERENAASTAHDSRIRMVLRERAAEVGEAP
jgi:hypothetical protein